MENTHAVLRMQVNPYPAYIISGEVVYREEDRHPERIFPAFVMMFIEEGTLYFTEGDTAYTLRAGEWFIQTPGVRHYGHRVSGEKTVFHYVHFMPQGEWRIESVHSARYVRIIDGGEGIRVPSKEIMLPMRGRYSHASWRELFRLLEQPRPPDRGAIAKQAHFLELLERMVWLEAERETVNVPLQHAIAYIQQHYAEPITVAELAARYHFSPDHLTRQIKKATGMTPSALLTRYRLNQAKHLLVHTNDTVQRICHSVGYSDLAIFSRMFKRHAGLSPAQYRKAQWGRLHH